MNLVYQDARSGRRFDQAFECWGAPAVGGLTGPFDPTYVFPYRSDSCSDPQFAGISAGMTLAQAVANLNMLIIELGTNDQYVPLGVLGDATNAGTFYGNMRWVVETYENANPAMRIVLVTVQYNGFAPVSTTQQYATATQAYANSIGLPVINMFNNGGLNAITAPVLTIDSTHPSAYGFASFYGPVIAQGVQQIF
jgi:hypothetical protein